MPLLVLVTNYQIADIFLDTQIVTRNYTTRENILNEQAVAEYDLYG